MLRTVFFLSLIFLFPYFGHSAAAASSVGPKTYLPESEFFFKAVLEGAEVVHGFVVYNQGDEPLEILDVKTG
ncbi:hypothetical protein JWG88_09765 [Desulfopila inferna]|nr:hypothetical protein [Desulfopila inferna]